MATVLILDTAFAFHEYMAKVKGFGYFEAQAPAVVRTIIEYIRDATTAQESLSYYVHDIQDFFQASLSPTQLELLGEAIRNLGMAIYMELLRAKAYSPEGVLLFEFTGMLGSDIILTKNLPNKLIK